MAHTYKLVEANTSKEINLAYNASTNPNWLVNTGSPSLSSPVTPKFHKPDNAPPEIIALIADIRPMTFSMIVQGDDDPDTLLNNIATLAKWVDGPSQQAAQHYLKSGMNRIELHIKLDGATNTTKIPVIYGNVSAFDSLFTEYGATNTAAFGATVQLYLDPDGEGESYTPNNLLPNSDFHIESSTSGLAAGLSLVNSPTCSLSTSNWLYGGQSQRILTDTSSSHGFDTDLQTITSGTSIVAFVYILASSSGNDPITIRLQDGSGNVIQDKTYNPANASGYDKSATAFSNTNRFRRYVVSGTNSAANARIRVFRAASNATQETEFWVDCIYMETGTTTAPPFWCSHTDLDNRNDADSTSTRRVNTLDFFDIPGDSEALLTLAYSPTPSSKQIFIMGRGVDGQYSAGSQPPWVEAQGGSGWTTSNVATNGAWSTPTDAGYSASNALRFTASGGAGEGTHSAISSSTATRKMLSGKKRVFLIAETNNVGTVPEFTIEIKAGVGTGSKTTILKAISHNVETANQHLLFDCGTLNATQIMNQYATDLTLNTTFNVIISAYVSSGNWIQFDGLFIMPTHEFGIQYPLNAVPAAGTLYFDGRTKQMFLKSSGVAEPTRGGVFRLSPGIGNRLAFVQTASDNQISITEAFTVTPTVTPRTRHLLGTS